jgi:hypothetical protein
MRHKQMELDLSQLGKNSESEVLELKESFDNKTLETIGAFANTCVRRSKVAARAD